MARQCPRTADGPWRWSRYEQHYGYTEEAKGRYGNREGMQDMAWGKSLSHSRMRMAVVALTDAVAVVAWLEGVAQRPRSCDDER